MWLLLVLALVTRLPYWWDGVIPFSFDHGRDSLAVLHMIKTGALKFIGPWTSIPGLFFGPGWYYLLAPAYLISDGHPLSGVALMLLLGLIQIWLAYKYLGVYESVMITAAPIWLILSTSAANPFPITLVSLIIIILLKQIVTKRKASLKQIAGLGLMVGLGFHFCSALAIFYMLIIPLSLGLRRIKLTAKKIAAGAGTLALTFVPQLLFEIKHKFIQTRALLAYFSQGESQKINPGKIKIVTSSILNELGLAVLPDINWLRYLGLGLLLMGLIYLVRKKKFEPFWLEIGALIVIPTIGFWFLHYNPWYVYGLLPVAVLAVGQILRAMPKVLAGLYLAIVIISPVYGLYHFYGSEKEKLIHHKSFLPAKMKALEYIYNQTEGKPFASYHYLPEIYDYVYQYLYLWQGFKGRPLPVEFSYQPGEIIYVSEKPDLLARLPITKADPEKIFLIIEKPENVHHYPLQAWLDRIEYEKIVSRKVFGDELEVWEAMPAAREVSR